MQTQWLTHAAINSKCFKYILVWERCKASNFLIRHASTTELLKPPPWKCLNLTILPHSPFYCSRFTFNHLSVITTCQLHFCFIFSTYLSHSHKKLPRNRRSGKSLANLNQPLTPHFPEFDMCYAGFKTLRCYISGGGRDCNGHQKIHKSSCLHRK